MQFSSVNDLAIIINPKSEAINLILLYLHKTKHKTPYHKSLVLYFSTTSNLDNKIRFFMDLELGVLTFLSHRLSRSPVQHNNHFHKDPLTLTTASSIPAA